VPDEADLQASQAGVQTMIVAYFISLTIVLLLGLWMQSQESAAFDWPWLVFYMLTPILNMFMAVLLVLVVVVKLIVAFLERDHMRPR
jgi:hypothetical protein